MKEFIEKLIGRLEELRWKTIFDAQCLFENSMVDKCVKTVKELAEEYNNDFCEWRLCDEEANVYDTTCRNPHILIEGSPTDNNYEYCPYCGKKIKVAPYQPKGE